MITGLLVLVLLAGAAFYLSRHEPDRPVSVAVSQTVPAGGQADRMVLDISVHTLDELRVLLDRAEQLSVELAGGQASVVLVLHGPEVEYFSSGNYAQFHDVVDQAARLDANDIVDVRICQTMMSIRGVPRDDIPAFIEQVPDGQAEIERLVRQGYVYF